MRFRTFALCLIIAFTPLLGSPVWGFELKTYADITYLLSSSDDVNPDEKNGSFRTSELDLVLTHLITDRIDVLSEVTIEPEEEAAQSRIDLERIHVGYLLSDAFKIHVGRFHNILGYWIPTFFHTSLFQTTIRRPSFALFEHNGGILPVHLVGVWASGTVRTSLLDLDYGLMVTNGFHIDKQDDAFFLTPEIISDTNKNKAVSANLIFRPTFLTGLELGLSGFTSQVDGFNGMPESLKILEVDQMILAVHLVYTADNNGIQFLSEYYSIRDEDVLTETGSFTSNVYYIQVGYYFAKQFIPYIRYEQVRIDEEDPYFSTLGMMDSHHWLYGLRFTMNPLSALKAEAQVINLSGFDRYTRYALQWTFGF